MKLYHNTIQHTRHMPCNTCTWFDENGYAATQDVGTSGPGMHHSPTFVRASQQSCLQQVLYHLNEWGKKKVSWYFFMKLSTIHLGKKANDSTLTNVIPLYMKLQISPTLLNGLHPLQKCVSSSFMHVSHLTLIWRTGWSEEFSCIRSQLQVLSPHFHFIIFFFFL